MTPTLIIEHVAAEGIRLTLGKDGKIKATGDQVAVTRWLPIIRAQKPGIVAALQAAGEITGGPATAPPCAPGNRITWAGSGGKANKGVVDFLDTCPGEVWAFVTIGEHWAAVNMKFVTQVEEGGQS